MIKNLYVVIIILCNLHLNYAQIDTVLFENFQFDVFSDMPMEYTGEDETWVNYDEDQLPSIFQTDETMRWHGGQFFTNALDSMTGETEFVAISVSYLLNFLPGNRNWLILPPIEIEDDSYMLHWESSPSQLPRYMDGYEVMISTTGNNVETDFTESLFKAASMDQIVGDDQSTDFSNFLFTEGYLHAMGGTDSTYFVPGETVYFGLLEPHSIDLSAYFGQTVYIAFLHNSDDDDRLAINDILVTRAGTSSLSDVLEQNRIECYPNPAKEIMNLSYRLTESSDVNLSILQTDGKQVLRQQLGRQNEGVHIEPIGLSGLSPGMYQLNVMLGDALKSIPFIKK